MQRSLRLPQPTRAAFAQLPSRVNQDIIMIRLINILLLSFISQLSFCQLIWLEPTTIDSKPTLTNRIDANTYDASLSTKTINYHPSVKISDPISISLGETNLNQCNIYTVYRPSGNAQEQLIWSIQALGNDQLSLTDRRMVDYTKSKFMNFVDRSPMDVQINNYQHYQNEYPGDRILIGGLPSNSKVPAQTFSGDISEMIIFNQMLAPMAKQQIESYLALKYSIPLSEGLDYVDGNTDILWQANKEKKYKHRIAGIGRDHRTTLDQKQTQSKLGTGSISIRLKRIENLNYQNENILSDQEYLLWSDDDGSIDYEAKEAQNPLLQRKWKLYTKRFQSDESLVLRLEYKDIVNELKNNEEIWLVVDHSGNDKFRMNDSEFYLLKNIDTYVETSPFQISNEHDLHFSFMKAPEMFAAIDLTLPNCEDENGMIEILAIGGQAPYQIHIDSENYDHEILLAEGNNKYQLKNITAGEYRLEIIDSNQKKWVKNFYLNSKEIDIPQLKNVYQLEGESLTIDAQIPVKSNYRFQWLFNEKIISNKSKVNITQPGTYQLIIEDGHCIFQKNIEIKSINNNIEHITLYPNPTTTGYTSLHAALKEATDYSITITDVSGRQIYHQEFPSTKYIQWNKWINRSGIYLITLQSGTSIKTRKLVVEKY